MEYHRNLHKHTRSSIDFSVATATVATTHFIELTRTTEVRLLQLKFNKPVHMSSWAVVYYVLFILVRCECTYVRQQRQYVQHCSSDKVNLVHWLCAQCFQFTEPEDWRAHNIYWFMETLKIYLSAVCRSLSLSPTFCVCVSYKCSHSDRIVSSRSPTHRTYRIDGINSRPDITNLPLKIRPTHRHTGSGTHGRTTIRSSSTIKN